MKRGEKIGVNAPLPLRSGVAASRVFMPQGTWPDLLAFLLDRFKYMPADVLRNRLAQGGIVDEAGVAQTLDSPYRPLHWLWYYREVPDETPIPFDLPVLHRDAHLLVVDKPHFLPSIPAGRHLRETALTRLRSRFDLPEISPIHRLDRDTAGVMLFCVDRASRGAYQFLFQSRRVNKEYEAVAPVRAGLPHVRCSRIEAKPPGFMVREVDGPPNSETHIELMDRRGEVGYYRLRPRTGRKHQLRLHMSALGIPIRNDRFYPEAQAYRDADDFSDPLQLLARSIEFDDPFSGQRRRFESQRQLACW